MGPPNPTIDPTASAANPRTTVPNTMPRAHCQPARNMSNKRRTGPVTVPQAAPAPSTPSVPNHVKRAGAGSV